MAKKKKIVSKVVRGAAEGQPSVDMGFALTGDTTPTAETSPFKGFNYKDSNSSQKEPSNGVQRRSSIQKEPSNGVQRRSSIQKEPSNGVQRRSSSQKEPSNGVQRSSSQKEPSNGVQRSSSQKEPSNGVQRRSSIQKEPSNGVQPRSSSQKETSQNHGISHAKFPSMTPKEKIANKKARDIANKRKRRQSMTPEAREVFNAKKRQEYQAKTAEERRKKRTPKLELTEEEREEKREKERKYRRELCKKQSKEKKEAKKRQKRQAMTPEAREAFNAKKRQEYHAMTVEERRQKRTPKQELTEDEREEEREKDNAYRRELYKKRSEEKKAAIIAKKRQKRQAMSPEARSAYYKRKRSLCKKKSGKDLEGQREKERQRNKRYYDRTMAKFNELPKVDKKAKWGNKYERNKAWRSKNREKVLSSKRIPATCTYCRKTVVQPYLNRHVEMHRRCAQFHAPLTSEQRSEIEFMSRRGAGSKARKYRIPGTRAKEVLTWTRDGKDLTELAFDYSHPSSDGFMSQPMRDGKKFEIDAINAYQKVLGISDASIQKKVGLLVHPRLAYLGATPDARYTTEDGKMGCIEVKYVVKGITTAKYLLKENSRIWIPGKSGEYLTPVPTRSAEMRQLNRNYKYFTQVIMQIMCGDMAFCDFVVYTKNTKNPEELQLWKETISREEAEEKWKGMEPTLTDFFDTYLGPPALFTGNTTRSVADLFVKI